MSTQPQPGLPMASMSQWLEAIGLSRLEPVLLENGIAEDVITSLTESDLEKLGFSMGDRKRLMRAINDLLPAAASAQPGEVIAASQPHTELRQLTIMFCDLVEATALCARLSPEQWRQVVLAYQQAAVAVITRCGGTVAQYLGDGLLVYFGYPQALEDAAVRAVLAGLELIDRIAELDIAVDGREHVRLQLRIGIDTGRVVIGDIGAGPRREQLALGDTPNIAARLQGLAKTNTVLITDQTRRLTAGNFTYEDQGVHALKGVTEPRQVWRVMGVSDTLNRFDAASGEQLSPLVGRVQEMSLLMDRWQTVLQGQGQVVLLSGEPGIGKSRMLKELCDRLGSVGAKAVQLQCAAHRADSAFHPFVDAIERMLRIKPDTPLSIKLDRIDALVNERMGGAMPRHAALLAAMLSIPSDGRHALPVSSAHLREQEIIEVLVDLLQSRAGRSPFLMVFEDAHWADPASIAALNALVERARQLPVLMVVTHRPEFVPAFDRQVHVTALKVPGLKRSEVLSLVSRLMGDQALPDALVQQIESRTDGVPLFVEELTKSVKEQGGRDEAGVETISTLPSTLRDSLMARLDRHAVAKEVAQIGAVIGREFAHDLLEALFPQNAQELDEGIESLLRSGLAMRQDGDHGPVYVFKHAMVQDTAYDSLLKARREGLHAAVVTQLEARYPETVQHQPALLARHASAAGMAAAAIPYWRKASEQALNRLALHEAAAHLQAGLQVSQRLPANAERDQVELQLHASLGTVHMLGKGWAAPEVAHAYKRANELASAADKLDEAIWPLWGVCVYHQVRGEIGQAQAIGRRMGTVARQANSRHAWLVHNMMQAQLCFYGGQLPDVPSFCEQVEHGFNDPQDRSLIALYSTDLKLVSMVHGLHAKWIMGQVDDLDAAYLEIEQRALALAHPYSLAWARTWGVMAYLHAGELDRVLPRLQSGWHLADEHGFAYVSALARFAMGWCRTQLGQVAEGIDLMTQGFAAFQATGAGIVLPFFLTLMAEVWGKVGRVDEALDFLAQARELTDQGGERWHDAEWHRIKGDVLRRMPEVNEREVRACYQQALAVATTQQAVKWQVRAEAAMATLG